MPLALFSPGWGELAGFRWFSLEAILLLYSLSNLWICGVSWWWKNMPIFTEGSRGSKTDRICPRCLNESPATWLLRPLGWPGSYDKWTETLTYDSGSNGNGSSACFSSGLSCDSIISANEQSWFSLCKSLFSLP